MGDSYAAAFTNHVIAHEGVMTEDGRAIALGGLTWEGTLPVSAVLPGHTSPSLVGAVSDLQRIPTGDGTASITATVTLHAHVTGAPCIEVQVTGEVDERRLRDYRVGQAEWVIQAAALRAVMLNDTPAWSSILPLPVSTDASEGVGSPPT